MRPVYFDLSVRDVDAARQFFSAVLDWQFDSFPGVGYPYFSISTSDAGGPGMNGGVGAIAHAPVAAGHPLTLLTIETHDLEATLTSVVEHGGSIVESKTAIPSVGWFATCAEPGGLLFGLIQPDPTVS